MPQPSARVECLVEPSNADRSESSDSNSDEYGGDGDWELKERMVLLDEGESDFVQAVHIDRWPMSLSPLADRDLRDPLFDWVLQREGQRLHHLWQWHDMMRTGIPRQLARQRSARTLRRIVDAARHVPHPRQARWEEGGAEFGADRSEDEALYAITLLSWTLTLLDPNPAGP